MGQKSNLITLKFFKLSNFYSRLNFQEFIYIFSFLKYLNFLFLKKKLFLTNSLLFFFENKIFLKCFLFFRIAYFKYLEKQMKKLALKIYIKMKKFKLKKKNQKKNLCILKKLKKKNYSLIVKINKVKKIFNSLKFFKNNLIIFTFINLNIYLEKKKFFILIFFNYLKKMGLKVFPRRLRFFLEFIQLSILFLENKIEIKFFISILCEIFRILTKKLHSKFFIFINEYFKFLLSNPLNNKHFLLGIKFIINGKLKGKTRSNSYTFKSGTIPIQSLKAAVDFTKAHTFTRFGVFGFKLWIYKNSYSSKYSPIFNSKRQIKFNKNKINKNRTKIKFNKNRNKNFNKIKINKNVKSFN